MLGNTKQHTQRHTISDFCELWVHDFFIDCGCGGRLFLTSKKKIEKRPCQWSARVALSPRTANMDTAEDDSLPGLNDTSSRGSAAAAGQQASFQPEAAAQQTSSMGQDAVVTTFDDTAVTFAAPASASSTHTPFSIHAQPLDHDSRHVGQRQVGHTLQLYRNHLYLFIFLQHVLFLTATKGYLNVHCSLSFSHTF